MLFRSKMFKLLILTTGFNEVTDEAYLSNMGRLVRAEDFGHGLKRGKNRQEKACSNCLKQEGKEE